jgi:hypothetical protein
LRLATSTGYGCRPPIAPSAVNGGIVPARAAQFLVGPYRVPAAQFEVAIFHSNKTPVGSPLSPPRIWRSIDFGPGDSTAGPVAANGQANRRL